MNVHLTLLLVYSVGLTIFGLWIARLVRGSNDFFVAGRQLSWPLIFSTVLAANIGAGTTVGATGLAYREGVSAWWWVGSAGIGSLLLAFVIGPRIWRLASARQYLTVGDFLEDRYGPSVRGIVAMLLWIGSLFILAGQLLAGAAVFEVVADIPRGAGIAIGGMAMTLYFTAGGLLSSAWVNAVQLVVLLGGFAAAVVMLPSPPSIDEMRALDPFILVAPDAPGVSNFWYSSGAGSGFTLLLLLGPNFVVSPGLVQKAYGARSDRDVRLGIGVNAVALLLFATLPVLFGLGARQLHPGISDPNVVLPTLLKESLPVWLGALALAAVFSAEVSTCDAILFMLATTLSKDLYKRFVDRAASDARVLAVARWAAIGGGIGGMLIAAYVTRTIVTALSVFYSMVGATLFVPLVAGLFTKRPGAREAIASILAGMAALLAVQYGTDRTGWWNPNLWGLAASALAYAVVYALRPLGART